jgi:hypothetical protein
VLHKYNIIPLCAKSDANVNEVKITTVPISAVTIMLGLTPIAASRSGPIPIPENI